MPSPKTAGDFATNSMFELGVYSPSETPSATDLSFVIDKSSRLIGEWNAQKQCIFAYDFLEFTLPPNIQPISIGQAAFISRVVANGTTATYTAANSFKPGQLVDIFGCTTPALNGTGIVVVSATAAAFVTATSTTVTENETPTAAAVFSGYPLPNFGTIYARPANIQNANIVLTNVSPIVKIPLHIRDADWWAANTVPTVPSSIPTDLYYEPSWPNGLIYLWPMQNFAYGLELQGWNDLPEMIQASTAFYMPQGYENALTYTLAEACAPAFKRRITPELAGLASRSRAAVFGNNNAAPDIKTRDAGMPTGNDGKTYFNWLNGMTVTR